LLIVGWIGHSDAVQQRLASLFHDRHAVLEQRLPHWWTALDAAGDFWPLGSGLGTYRYVYRLYEQNPDQPWFYHAENQYLEALLEAGPIGLVLLLAAVVLTGAACWRLVQQEPASAHYAVGIAGLFALASQAIASFFDFGLYIPANMLLFALVCGVVAGCAANLNTGDADPAGRATGAQRGSLLAAFHTRALAASIVSLLAVAMGSGAAQANRLARFQTAQQSAAAVLAQRQVPPQQMRGAVQRVAAQLAAHSDNARAHQLAADLQIHAFRVARTARALESTSTRLTPTQLWNTSSLDWFHNNVQQCVRTNRLADLQNLRDDPLVQMHLHPARQELLASRDACPLLPTVHVRLAELAGIVDAPDTDRVHLQRAHRLAPADPALLQYVATLELTAGRPDAACRSWRQCLQVAPGQLDAVLGLAAANLDLPTHVDDLLPDSPELLIRVARDKFSGSNQRDLRWAIANKADRLVQSGKFTESEQLYFAGACLALKDQSLRAIRSMASAVQLAPDRAAWRYELAVLLRQRGMLDQAQEQASQCVRLAPDDEQYQALLRDLIHTKTESDQADGWERELTEG
jgi:tetratricopeptide (TPR) repeat protein